MLVNNNAEKKSFWSLPAKLSIYTAVGLVIITKLSALETIEAKNCIGIMTNNRSYEKPLELESRYKFINKCKLKQY